MFGAVCHDVCAAAEVAFALARAGVGAVVVLDGPLPDGACPVLVADGAGLTAALEQIAQAGCTQVLVTHDPDCAGPIGAMADAVVAAMGTGFAVAVPASPASGFTLYQGHVFRRQALLHPGVPGDQSNYVRLLSLQSDGTAGLVAHGVVRRGAGAVRAAMAGQREQGRRVAVVDAVDEADLQVIGAALVGQSALLGAPTLAGFVQAAGPPLIPAEAADGPGVILAAATGRDALFQAAMARERLPHTVLGPDALDWAIGLLGETPLLIVAPPGLLDPVAFAACAAGVVTAGARRILITGPAVAAAVVQALEVHRLWPAAREPWLVTDGKGLPTLAFVNGIGARSALLDAFDPD